MHAQIVARNSKFREPIQADPGGRVFLPKNFYLRKSEIVHDVRIPFPKEGRFAVVTDVGSGMRWTRLHVRRTAQLADDEHVWS
jgi:hypothetical protein